MQRVALLNGSTINQDYDWSALWVALIDGWVYEWLGLSNVSWNNRKVTPWKALVKVTRTNGQRILVHYENTADFTFTSAWPFKVWIEIDQSNIDNPLLNPANGSGIGTIAYDTSYPAGNYISLGEVNWSNTITGGATVIVSISDAIQDAIDEVTTGGTNFWDITVNSILLPGWDVQGQIDAINTNISNESELSNKDYMTWEALNIGDSLYVERWPLFIEAKAVLNVWDVAGNARQSIKAIGSGIWSNTLKLALRKFVSPSVNLNVYIETDDNGKPSGQLFSPNAIATIASSSLTTSLADTTLFLSWSTVSDGHGVTLSVNETSQTIYKWLKIKLTSQVYIWSVTKVSSCTATKAYIYDTEWVLIQSVSFVWNIATFNNSSLIIWKDYYIVVGSDGASYTSTKQSGSASFPYILSKSTILQGANLILPNQTLTITHGSVSSFSSPWWEAGMYFSVSQFCYLKSATKYSGSTIRLRDRIGWNVLASADGSDNFANYLLSPGVIYYMSVDYYNVHYNTSSSFPQTDWLITILWWYNPFYSWSNVWSMVTSITVSQFAQDDADINNIVSMSLSENILIPKWQPVHIVCFQWSYGSETINATNYYGIWCMIRETRTRYSMKYNWSDYLSSESAALVTDTDNITLNTNSTGSNAARWYKLLAIDNIRISAVNKDGSFCDATRAVVKNNAWSILATATFSWNVATFSSDVKITIGSYFRIELDSNGSNYQAKRTTAPSYPQARTNVSYISGSIDWVDDPWFAWNIDSVDTLVINTFAYCSSPLFSDLLLSKTSAYYQYKMPNIPRIARFAYNVGDIVSYDFKWITTKISTANIWYPLYIANAHWLSSILPGNIKFHLGDVTADNNVLLAKGKSYVLWTIDIIYADDDVVSSSLINTLTKVKEFIVKDTMTMNIYFEHRFVTDGWGAGSATVVSRIYKNGVALWTTRTDTSTSFVSYTESLSLTAWDLVQLYTSSWRTVNPSVVEVKNFRVLWTIQREYMSDFIKSF